MTDQMFYLFNSRKEMDRYDSLILEIIHNHRLESKGKDGMRLRQVEEQYYKEIQADGSLNMSQSKVGERITSLFMEGYIEIKNGYSLTGKGRRVLELV